MYIHVNLGRPSSMMRQTRDGSSARKAFSGIALGTPQCYMPTKSLWNASQLTSGNYLAVTSMELGRKSRPFLRWDQLAVQHIVLVPTAVDQFAVIGASASPAALVLEKQN